MGGVSEPGRLTSSLVLSHTRELICTGPSPPHSGGGHGAPTPVRGTEAKLRCTISSEDVSQLAGGKGVGRREGSRWVGALQGRMTSALVWHVWPLEDNVRKGMGELHAGELSEEGS